MSDFKLFETAEFMRCLEGLSNRDAGFITGKLKTYVYPQLRQLPFAGTNIKKLKGYKPDTWRYRIGKFRIFYLIDQHKHIVFLLSVDLRKDSYR